MSLDSSLVMKIDIVTPPSLHRNTHVEKQIGGHQWKKQIDVSAEDISFPSNLLDNAPNNWNMNVVKQGVDLKAAKKALLGT